MLIVFHCRVREGTDLIRLCRNPKDPRDRILIAIHRWQPILDTPIDFGFDLMKSVSNSNGVATILLQAGSFEIHKTMS
jgi:hypothetical protein